MHSCEKLEKLISTKTLIKFLKSSLELNSKMLKKLMHERINSNIQSETIKTSLSFINLRNKDN